MGCREYFWGPPTPLCTLLQKDIVNKWENHTYLIPIYTFIANDSLFFHFYITRTQLCLIQLFPPSSFQAFILKIFQTYGKKLKNIEFGYV